MLMEKETNAQSILKQNNTIKCVKAEKEVEFNYIWWNGEKLNGPHIAYDTETELIQSSLHVPNASLAMAYDGEILCLIHPSKLKDFFMQHKQKHFVGHNFAFDFWVTQKIIGGRSLWELADKGYIHDTMILDQLIQLGTGKYRIAGGGFGNSDKVYAAGLGTLSKECNSVELDKGDQYRLRFGELLNLTEEEIKNHPEFIGFISYALPDVIATFDVYIDVKQKAYDLMVKAGYKKKGSKYEIFPNAIEKWGLLSEAIQVRGSISLAQLSREPLKINLEERQKYEDEQRKIIADCYTIIESRNPEIIKRNSAKAKKAVPLSPKLKESTGLPAFNEGVLKIVLQKEADKLRIKAPISDGKKGGISTSTKVWIQYADKSEFIDAWCKLEKHTMLLQFLVKLNHPYIYTAYDLLKKTGRTGSSAHRKTKGSDVEIPSVNIQQMPRDNRLRNLFCKDEDSKKWYICDYGYIELRTLAATCKGRFGFSNLGNVICQHTRNGGIDPHEKMAAAVAKLTDEQYAELDKKEKKIKRQAAKACFHKDVEVLVKGKGWVKVSELDNEDIVMQYWPGCDKLEWAKPLALTFRENQKLVRVYNKGVDIRVTEDHRMVGFVKNGTPKIVFPDDMNLLRGVWNAGKLMEGRRWGNLDEKSIRQAVAIQADGSYSGNNKVRFVFKKQRKIDRFIKLFDLEGTKINRDKVGQAYFTVPLTNLHKCILTDRKTFKLEVLLELLYSWREAFLDEVQYWDSNVTKTGLIRYGSIERENVDAIQAIAAINNRKSLITIIPAHGNNSTFYPLTIKEHNHTRGGTFKVEELEGLHTVYCLSMPSSYVLVRDKERVVITANCSFGLPGGLGSKKFIDYAKTQYSVSFTEKEAVEAKKIWLTVYPEMNRHLQDVSLEAVCYNLQVKPSEVRKCFPKNGKWADELRYLRDTLFKWKEIGDKALTEEDIAKLVGLCNKNRPDLIPLIPEPTQWKNLHDEIFLYRASTLTGRVRGKVGYCDGCNSPFQGLASDGGKEAIWRLMYLGYNVKMFIHDEIVTSIDSKYSLRDSKRIKQIMIDEMEKVIGHNIPVNCEGHIADFWIKE